jgi:cell division protein ZapA (FtsZ GTPase activity inhibitor)
LDDARGQSNTIKILGKEYRVRTDRDPEHLQEVARYLEDTLQQICKTTPDTQDAAVLAALNMASELLQMRQSGGWPRVRLQALIDLIDSA